MPFYPSYYPHEIAIQAAARAAAADLLVRGALHAYAGADPFAGRAVPTDVAHVGSLGAYVVVTFPPAPPRDRERRCVAARRIASQFRSAGGRYASHPYPVTPYHADYLEHFDLARAAADELARGGREPAPLLTLRARGAVVTELLGEAAAAERAADATIDEIEIEELLGPHRVQLNGWLGPPWLKEGWYHAYLLHAGHLSDAGARRTAEELYARLVRGAWRDRAEHATLARRLVSLLRRGCERVVVGYTIKREAFNAQYSDGVENVGWDGQEGLAGPLFVRTVKLKDFPWNGWLRVGVDALSPGAWNPVTGFEGAAGRLLWSALGDPALFLAPGGGWLENRAQVVGAERSPSGELPVARDALLPAVGTGRLLPVGEATRARARLVYKVLGAPFHDGTRLAVADVVFPYAFAFAWGARAGPDDADHDPEVARSTALVREWLTGFRILRVSTEVLKVADLELTYRHPIVEVYLRHAGGEDLQAAAVAPPGSAVPWHVVALMEEAVRRGWAAFSAEEARRRGVPQLDLVRDARLSARLASLVTRLEAAAHIPEPLRALVSPAEARERWAALARFHAEHGHFLVTSGPYRLARWDPSKVVLQVVRDYGYPLGVGTFDRYAIPLRAYAVRIERRGEGLEVSATTERVVKFQRTHEIVVEPLGGGPRDAERRAATVCRYLVVRSSGEAVRAGTIQASDDGRFRVNLDALEPGSYRVLVSVVVWGNALDAEVRMVDYTARGS
ncbi:MAG: hypothetical protein HY726_15815 [Candidatus Rokubacteria bacterium]|nr:hypothetical protein [Candidatus Rokubacteria bacterium]